MGEMTKGRIDWKANGRIDQKADWLKGELTQRRTDIWAKWPDTPKSMKKYQEIWYFYIKKFDIFFKFDIW